KRLVAELERRDVLRESALDDVVDTFLLNATPANGKRAVARAWSDASFRARLLEDAGEAVAEIGIDMSHWAPVKLRAVENTAERHNLIVCTLCSCYPIALLGPSPTWYKSEAYRSRAVRDPRGVLAEFGITLVPEVQIAVWDSTAETRYIVIPMRPSATETFSEDELAALVTRNGMIGTALV
ncbi:MAG TPA: nitrile hydratase subunit alpha, partial [Candidatus Baltobacteraceae bacterium]|nr:nitrile hydratase subunit alpha [Candidatus Baltobacteraceae bacterium]